MNGTTVRTLVWVDRYGREEPIAAAPRAYTRARISPDGTQAALDLRDNEQDVWILDFARETLTRLTFDPGRDGWAEWMPDGEYVVFTSERGGVDNLYRKAADGTGVVERLSDNAHRHYPQSFTPDGTRLVIHDISGDNQSFVFSVLALGGEPAITPLLDTKFFLDDAVLSRDGRWLAYTSNASGDNEVYVRPFPSVDSGRWQISSDFGRYPVWGPDGDELFFWASDGALMRVPIDTETAFRPANPEVLIEPGSYFVNPFERAFDIAPDGKRFLMLKEQAASDAGDPYAGLTQFIVVHNWFQELNARVPVD